MRISRLKLWFLRLFPILVVIVVVVGHCRWWFLVDVDACYYNSTLYARAVLHHLLIGVYLNFSFLSTTPSYLSFSDNEHLIGDAAKNQVAMNFHNTYVYLYLHVLI